MPWARSNASPEGCAQSAYTAGESRGSVTATARRERGAQGRGSSPGRAVIRYSSRCPTTAATGRDIELVLSVALADLPPARAVIEAGPRSPWLSRLMARVGHEVVVANPRQVELIARNHRKTDRQGPRGRAPVVHGRGLSPQDGGPHPSRAPSGAVAAGGDDRRTDCPHRSSRPGHRGAVRGPPRDRCAAPGHRRGAHHRAHVRAHDRGSRPLPEEPGGRRLPRACAEAARLGEARTATRHQQERRPGLETAARAARALHPRSVRPRSRSAPLGWTARGHAGTRARERAAVAVARRLAVLLLALWKSGEVFEPLRHATARDAALRAAATTRDDRDRWKRRPRAAAKRRAVLGPEATRSCPGRFRSRAIGPRGRRA